MGDVLDTGLAWLDAQRHRHMSGPIRYRRGSLSVDVLASVGHTVFRIDDGYGRLLRTESRDYLVRAVDLVLDGSPILPQYGDEVHETREGVTYRYEVLAPAGEPEWRYSDPYRKTLRIHTKFMGTEAAP